MVELTFKKRLENRELPVLKFKNKVRESPNTLDEIEKELSQNYLENEVISIRAVIKFIINRNKNWSIIKLVKSNENKKYQTTADLIVKNTDGNIITISIKNKRGCFTLHNLGTTYRSVKWLEDKIFLQELKEVERCNKKIRDDIDKKYKRWTDIGDPIEEKALRFEAIKDYLHFYYTKFCDENVLYSFLMYLCSRESDCFIVTDYDKVIHYTDKVQNKNYFNVESMYIKNKSIIIEPYYEVRFKSEGGKTKSSIKMNIQPLK